MTIYLYLCICQLRGRFLRYSLRNCYCLSLSQKETKEAKNTYKMEIHECMQLSLHLHVVVNLECNPYLNRLSDLGSLSDMVGVDTLVMGKFAGVPRFGGAE